MLIRSVCRLTRQTYCLEKWHPYVSQLNLLKPVGREFESRPTHQYQETLTSDSGGFVFVGWQNVVNARNNVELHGRFEWECEALDDRERLDTRKLSGKPTKNHPKVVLFIGISEKILTASIYSLNPHQSMEVHLSTKTSAYC